MGRQNDYIYIYIYIGIGYIGIVKSTQLRMLDKWFENSECRPWEQKL